MCLGKVFSDIVVTFLGLIFLEGKFLTTVHIVLLMYCHFYCLFLPALPILLNV